MRAQRRCALLLTLTLGGCGDAPTPAHLTIPGANAGRGGELIRSYGCGACHEVPNVEGARGRVGPSLAGWSGRALLAGIMPNTPQNLVAWLRDPPALVPSTGMPAMGLTERDARDMAAFLYTIGAETSRVAPPGSGLDPTGVSRAVALPGRGPFVGRP